MRPTIKAIVLPLSLFLIFCSFIKTDIPLKKKKNRDNICTEYTEKYVDKITGITRFIARDKIILSDFNAKDNFDLIWFRSREEFTLAIKAEKRMCFEYDVAVSFHLLQGKVITSPSSHISNCESLMTINFQEQNDTDSKIDILSTSEVVGISFDNGKSTYKLKLSPSQSMQFKQTLKCLKTKI